MADFKKGDKVTATKDIGFWDCVPKGAEGVVVGVSWFFDSVDVEFPNHGKKNVTSKDIKKKSSFSIW